MAATHPDLALGFADDVWWRREAQPPRHAWSDGQPVRRVGKTVPAQAPEGKAVAWYGLYGPTANQMLGRVGLGRPVRVVTCTVLAWRAGSFTAQGQRALLRIGDHASWHVSHAVQEWIKAHHRQAKQAGSGRFMVWR
jgi:hypothetical protein